MQEPYLCAQRNVQYHFCRTAIKLLWKSEKRGFAESLAIGGAPEGDVEGLLFKLLGDGEAAKKSARHTAGDFERRADAVGFEFAADGDQREIQYGRFPSIVRRV